MNLAFIYKKIKKKTVACGTKIDKVFYWGYVRSAWYIIKFHLLLHHVANTCETTYFINTIFISFLTIFTYTWYVNFAYIQLDNLHSTSTGYVTINLNHFCIVVYNNFYNVITIVRHMSSHILNIIALCFDVFWKFCNGGLMTVFADLNTQSRFSENKCCCVWLLMTDCFKRLIYPAGYPL
jgi:hypothetical protein